MAASNPHGDKAHLIPPTTLTRLVQGWLEEDCPSFDVGGYIVGEEVMEATLLAKSPGIIAGRPFFDEVFRQLDCTVSWKAKEGDSFDGKKEELATVNGPVRKLLLGERVALNVLARCSGIATRSKQFLDRLRAARYTGALAGTRKTTPGFRLVEKYGMIVGGCDPHRYDLSSMTMLKDNHIMAFGGDINQAISRAREVGGFSTKVEVECRTVEEAYDAAGFGADIVMLDNFSVEDIRLTSPHMKKSNERKELVLVEVSGGITEKNIEEYAREDVDVISTSAIHQGVPHVDFSLKILERKVLKTDMDL